ncbi:MAG TPA: M48 family metalloprotease [Caulobacteraceae bacterium]
MKPADVIITLAATFVALAACASSPKGGDETLLSLRSLDQRVAAVGWRLATANADLCPDTKPLTGLTLHEAAQYGGASRAEAVRRFGLTDAPAIQAIAPGSPAEAAGLRVDDIVTAADGQDLRNHTPSPTPTFDHLAKVWRQIDAAAADGEVVLDVRRADSRMRVVLRPVRGCAYLVQVRPSGEANAWADGRSVTVSSAAVRYLARDEDLALIMGHELAHNLLRHPVAISRSQEREADRVGIYLAARAGYDVSGAADFWRRFARDNSSMRLGFIGHPGASARAKAAAKTVAEIEALRTAGAPLIP